VRGLLENKVYDPKSLVQVIKFQLLIYEQVVKLESFTCLCQIWCNYLKPLVRYHIEFCRFSQNGGHPSSWICYRLRMLGVTYEKYLVFIVMQSLVGIGSVFLRICEF